jgi:phosphatidylserine/phosphatidylglycerophosphate/cardiolipin synthase-like enzyme
MKIIWAARQLGCSILLAAALASLTGCGSAATNAPDLPAPTAVGSQPGAPAQATPVLGAGIGADTLLVMPDDGTRAITGPIRAATHSLDLTTYLLTDHTLIHDLEYAHANGVQVRVILEHHPYGDGGSSSANQSAYDQLYAADIPVHWSNPAYSLTHEKTMIVDGTMAYILTLNYTKSAFRSNREFGVVDSNAQDVRAAEAIFTADWNDQPYTPSDPNLFLSPVNSRAYTLALIGRATRSIEVYAEEVQDTEVEQALVQAAQRGVQVRLITNAGDGTNAQGINVLQSGGVDVHQITAPYVHAKAILVDDKWAFVGSENISTSSLDDNRELGVLVNDQNSLARLKATFEQDWAAG